MNNAAPPFFAPFCMWGYHDASVGMSLWTTEDTSPSVRASVTVCLTLEAGCDKSGMEMMLSDKHMSDEERLIGLGVSVCVSVCDLTAGRYRGERGAGMGESSCECGVIEYRLRASHAECSVCVECRGENWADTQVCH